MGASGCGSEVARDMSGGTSLIESLRDFSSGSVPPRFVVCDRRLAHPLRFLDIDAELITECGKAPGANERKYGLLRKALREGGGVVVTASKATHAALKGSAYLLRAETI